MSKNINREKEIVEVPEEDAVVTTPAESEEIPEETEEKKPSKLKAALKKAVPFVVIGGVIATAFALGKHSGGDAMALAALEEENGVSEEIGEDDDATSEEPVEIIDGD